MCTPDSTVLDACSTHLVLILLHQTMRLMIEITTCSIDMMWSLIFFYCSCTSFLLVFFFSKSWYGMIGNEGMNAMDSTAIETRLIPLPSLNFWSVYFQMMKSTNKQNICHFPPVQLILLLFCFQLSSPREQQIL